MQPLPAVGYVRSTRPDAPKLDQCVTDIEDYARTHHMTLLCVYRDDGMPSTGENRSAFAQVVNQLCIGKAGAVIVPAMFHLSWQANLCAAMLGLIHSAGGRLHVVERPPLTVVSDALLNGASR